MVESNVVEFKTTSYDAKEKLLLTLKQLALSAANEGLKGVRKDLDTSDIISECNLLSEECLSEIIANPYFKNVWA